MRHVTQLTRVAVELLQQLQQEVGQFIGDSFNDLSQILVSCSVLQRVAACCSLLQKEVGQFICDSINDPSQILWSCSVLQRGVACCSVLQCVAVCCCLVLVAKSPVVV